LNPLETMSERIWGSNDRLKFFALFNALKCP